MPGLLKLLPLLFMTGVFTHVHILPSPYQEFGTGGTAGGYDERNDGDGFPRIMFHGTILTPDRTLQLYVMRRCAEVCLRKGGKWFSLHHEADRHLGGVKYEPGHRVFLRKSGLIWAKTAHAVMVVLAAHPQGAWPGAYDAREVLAAIERGELPDEGLEFPRLHGLPGVASVAKHLSQEGKPVQ